MIRRAALRQASTHAPRPPPPLPPPPPLSKQATDELSRMVRVDHAGELAAYQIYKGQLLILSQTHPDLKPLIKEMQAQEAHHLAIFSSLIAKHRVRPTVMTPIWKVAGFVLGASTAMMGKEAAMACTEAVETVIGEHYNDQIRRMLSASPTPLLHPTTPECKSLLQTIRQFRDDELEHLDTAIEHDSKHAPAHPILSAVIAQGCKSAIWISERI